MKNATLQIVGYGENAAIVVPRPLLEVFGFELGDQIRVPFDKCERVPPPKTRSDEDLWYAGTLGGRPVEFSKNQVLEYLERIKGQAFRNVRNYYVVHDGIEIPPKVIVSGITGVSSGLFNSWAARGILVQLGFNVQYKG